MAVVKQIETDPEAKEHLEQIMAYSAGSLIQIGDLLLPFLPGTASSIHATFSTGVVKLSDNGVLFPKIYRHTPEPQRTPRQ